MHRPRGKCFQILELDPFIGVYPVMNCGVGNFLILRNLPQRLSFSDSVKYLIPKIILGEKSFTFFWKGFHKYLILFLGASLISIIDLQKFNLGLSTSIDLHFNKAEFFKLSQASGFLVF